MPLYDAAAETLCASYFGRYQTGLSPAFLPVGVVDILSNAHAEAAIPYPVFLSTCSDSLQVL